MVSTWLFTTSTPPHAGFVGSLPEARNAIYGNYPRGLGTYAAEALASSVQRYQDHRGMYIIVITDGEFADKMQVQNYIVQQLLPQAHPRKPPTPFDCTSSERGTKWTASS